MGWLLPVVVVAGIYTLVAMIAERRGWLPDSVGVQGPILTLHTDRGIALLNRLSRPKRWWRAWGNFGLGIALVVMTATFGFLVFSALTLVQNPPPPTTINQPRNVLVIPGVNDFLPLSVAIEIVAGLAIGLVVHEGGHGLLCRVEDIEIDSMGLALLAVLPIGAFVEPDEASREACGRGGQSRMFAAGVTNNFLVAAIGFALLFGPVAGSIAVAPGAPIAGTLPGSPADRAGIDRGDRITAIDGTRVANGSDLDARLASADRSLRVTLDDGRETAVDRSLHVTGAVATNPLGLSVNETITAVNGTPVHTVSGFRSAVPTRNRVQLATSDGTRTGPVGAGLASVSPDRALADAGAPTGEDVSIVVTRIGDERVISASDLAAVMEDTQPGENVRIEAIVDGTRETYDVTLDAAPNADHGFLGVRVSPGTSGVSLGDFGVRTYPAAEYLGLLGGGDGGSAFGSLTDSPIGRAVVALFLPVGGAFGLPESFAGFTGGVANFYIIEGPLGGLGGVGFFLANLLFWTAWINLQLGFFNCIPAFPLDGGHMLRTSTEAILARLPFDPQRGHVRTVTVGVGVTMLASLLVTLFGPQLL